MNVDVGTSMGWTSGGDCELQYAVRTSDSDIGRTGSHSERTFEVERFQRVAHTGRTGDVNRNKVDGIMTSGGIAEVVWTNETDVRRCDCERNVCDVRIAAVTSDESKELFDDRDNGEGHGRGTKRSIEDTDEQAARSGAFQEERGVKRTYDVGQNLGEGVHDTNVAFSVEESNASRS